MVERVAVIFSNSDCVPVERFIFKLRVNQCGNGLNVEEGSLEFSLRSFLMKLSVSAPLTKLLPRGNSLSFAAFLLLYFRVA